MTCWCPTSYRPPRELFQGEPIDFSKSEWALFQDTETGYKLIEAVPWHDIDGFKRLKEKEDIKKGLYFIIYDNYAWLDMDRLANKRKERIAKNIKIDKKKPTMIKKQPHPLLGFILFTSIIIILLSIPLFISNKDELFMMVIPIIIIVCIVMSILKYSLMHDTIMEDK